MIDINILKEHIDNLKEGQRIELKNINRETCTDILKTRHGFMVGFHEPDHPYNGLVNISNAIVKVENETSLTITCDTIDNVYNSVTIFNYNFVCLEVIG